MSRNKKRKLKYGRIIILLLLILLIIFGLYKFFFKDKPNLLNLEKEKTMLDLVDMSFDDVSKYTTDNNLILTTNYEFSDTISKDHVISQTIEKGTKLTKDAKLEIVVSLGKFDKEKLANDGINELGNVPIMMYHGIINKKSSETNYTGGNVDRDGYNRTIEAFRDDLEFYYQKGYRMIRLIDYVHGDIDVEYGKSPIILTFDDGNQNNFNVTGIDESGNLIIDENCAVGALEEFKKKHPDYHVTATFFVNDYLFNQSEYNEKILNWLVDNGYDVGNHTKGHANLSKTTIAETQEVIADVYQKLDNIIPNKYVKIIALPFGNPTNKNHANFPYVLNGTANGYTYETEAALRVGWEPEVSPYNKDFDKTYMKRCRAYDNNGKDFDIEMVFKNLEYNKFVSDGNKDIIITSKNNSSKVGEVSKKIYYY